MSLVPYQQNGTLSTGIELVAQLERTGAITDQGLNPALFDATYDQCEAIAALCGRVRDVTAWLVGDLVAFSDRKFGEIAPQLVEATRMAPQTLLNYARVSRKVPFERRMPGLKHGHHAEVAALPPAQQTRWLKTAKREGLDRDALRARLRAERTEEPCEHEFVCRRCGEVRA